MDTLNKGPRVGQPASKGEGNDAIQSEIAALKTEFGELAASVAAAARTGVSDMQDAAHQRTDELRDAIRTNPTQAALISAGIGFVIGLLVTR